MPSWPTTLVDWILLLPRLLVCTVVGMMFVVTRFIWWWLLQLFPSNTDIDKKLKAVDGANKSDEQITVDGIYRLLGILDAKASALMRYDGIILAVITLSLSTGREFSQLASWIVVITLASIISCLAVVGVFWRFLEFVKTTDTNKLTDELDILRRVLVMREAAYQLAWWLALVDSILLIMYFNNLM